MLLVHEISVNAETYTVLWGPIDLKERKKEQLFAAQQVLLF